MVDYKARRKIRDEKIISVKNLRRMRYGKTHLVYFENWNSKSLCGLSVQNIKWHHIDTDCKKCVRSATSV